MPIEVAFNRLLLPVTVNRQSIYLYQDGASQVTITPTIGYDPVSRVVTVTPPSGALSAGQTYTLHVQSPGRFTDPSGLHAIDGATLDPSQNPDVTFAAGAAMTTALTPPPTIDYCTDIYFPGKVFQSCATSGACHTQSMPAEGLVVQGSGVGMSTAIGRAAQEVAVGPTSSPSAPSFHFPDGMPIIDPGTLGQGDPANSYLLYKVLMAEPSDTTMTVNPYTVSWSPISDDERAALAALIPGREMPFPDPPGGTPNTGLSVDQLETLSLWIAQGAQLPPSGSCQ